MSYGGSSREGGMGMFILNPFLMESSTPSKSRYGRDVLMVLAARRLYERTCGQGRLSWLWGLISRRSRRLLDLTTLEAACNIHARHYLGVQTVLIEQICGSEDRSADFDALFYPRQGHSRERWESIAAARMMGLVLPPVELIQVGDGYFVRDGHHRISVARALGEQYIEAEVTVWQVSGSLSWQWSASPTLAQPMAISPLLTAGNLDR
jgi:hypothetical protein